jgi:hypothetical protein
MMRNILGQTKSGFNIRQIMDEGKILLINLSKGKTGELNAKLLGMIFVMKFQAAAMSRQDIPEDERKDFCLFVDEFQNFATESFESILSEARKYRLNLVLANQFMTQLTDKIREALLGNVGTIMSGRLGVTDAELMEKAFSPVFTAEDLHKQPNFCAIATVMMFDMPSAPFTMKLPAPMGEPNEELMDSLKAYSATKFGRTRAEVEKEIQDRWSAAEKAKKATKPEMPLEPSRSSVDVVPIEDDKNTTSTPKTVPKAPETPKKGFLDDWMDKKAKTTSISSPTTQESTPITLEQAQNPAPVATPEPTPIEPTPTSTPDSTPASSPTSAPEVQPDEAVFKIR